MDVAVNEQGEIKANGLPNFSATWLFVGATRHHWGNRVDVGLRAAFEQPQKLNGCLLWDRDHGTLRQWGGRWDGKLPRITGACVVGT